MSVVSLKKRFCSFKKCGLSLCIGVLFLFSTKAANADLEHKVQKGQTLSAIAKRYGIKASTLASANRLSKTDTLQIGQVLQIPEEGIVYVQPGETLSKIAKTHHVSMKELAELNGIKTTSLLRIGQRLMLPGHEISEVSTHASKKWGRTRRRGVVTLVRLAPKERAHMRLVSKGGKVRSGAVHRLRNMLRHRQTGKKRKPHPQLLRLLTRVSDHFGGREIQLISGYRPPGGHTKRTSRHTKGHAIDLRVKGVPNKELIRYLRRFKHVGVGYYPRSTFVHMDIRSQSAYWVDWSRPGQAPIYTKPGAGPPEELVQLDRRFDAKKNDRDFEEMQNQENDDSSAEEKSRLSVKKEQPADEKSEVALQENTNVKSSSNTEPNKVSQKGSDAQQESGAIQPSTSEKKEKLKTVEKDVTEKRTGNKVSSKSTRPSQEKSESENQSKEVVKKESPSSTKKEEKEKPQSPTKKEPPIKKEMANREGKTQKSSSYKQGSAKSIQQNHMSSTKTEHQQS